MPSLESGQQWESDGAHSDVGEREWVTGDFPTSPLCFFFFNYILLLMIRILKYEVRSSEIGLFIIFESVSLSWPQIVVESVGKH